MSTPTSNRQIYVNLAVENLQTSIDFFTTLGFTFNPTFTDEHATCMIISDNAFVMLMTKSRFGDFSKKQITDSHTAIEGMFAISAGSREEVDTMVDAALANGGTIANEVQDMGFMYNRSFNDPDGHVFEVAYMDMSQMPTE